MAALKSADARVLTINGGSSSIRFAVWLAWREAQPVFASVKAAGLRAMHGMKHSEPERVTPYDPAHLPCEIGLIEAFLRRHPRLPQVACFDAAFQRT